MTVPALPRPVAGLAAELARLPGAEAVVLGGSRATGDARPDSDWDLGLYYRGARGSFDPAAVRALGRDGYVSALGEWGPIVDGGAWLTVDGLPVDVVFRDLDRVERWLADAEQGRFELLQQNGYLVGAPTYLPVGELAVCQVLDGELPRPVFPAALAREAPRWWEGHASVSLMFAGIHARQGDGVSCAGALSAAHGRLAARGEWALNEKRLLRRAGLDGLEPLIAAATAAEGDPAAAVASFADALGVAPLSAR